jgi:peptide/nickel transport system permease protein
MSKLLSILKQARKYPSATIGIGIILALTIMSIYTVITIPYGEAITLWRGGEGIWEDNPKNASPQWMNLFNGNRLPETIVLNSADDPLVKTLTEVSADFKEAQIRLGFDFNYASLPSEMTLFLSSVFEEVQPHVQMTWRTPDGREIELDERGVEASERYSISQDRDISRKLKSDNVLQGLFGSMSDSQMIQPGRYELILDGLLFEEGSDLDAKLVVYGQVHGVAGTDHRRRDLSLPLMWGTPVALAFGLLAAVGSTLSTLVIAAFGVWFGRWTDAAIQRITEINLILPVLPILILIGTFYSRSIWVMLGMVILLGVFSLGIKVYRAIFLQVKESPYIEAAQTYGAGSVRIVFRYMIPKVLPVLVPGFVTLIPSFVFLEATLAILGLGDPVLPTWGKVLRDANANGALYLGHYYWVLEPAALLMLTGLAFSMVGFTLDRIFNPRLRGL